MKNQRVLLVTGVILIVLLVGIIGAYLFATNNVSRLASSLSNRVAIVTGLDDIILQTTYDETFLDPHTNTVHITEERFQRNDGIH